DDVGPREARPRLAAQEKEAVSIVHRREVDEPGAAAIHELEAPHDPGQRDVGHAAQEGVDGARGERRRLRIDADPLAREMTAADRHRQRGIEDRMEGYDDPERAARRHGHAVYS